MTKQLPRLRVERLVIVESRSPTKFIRDVPLHAGLNIAWAQEIPSAATEVDRAGHGVGKTTFSLVLRAILGDDGAAVRTMRNHLAEHYGSGGIAAEVVVGCERFAVFRSFGSRSFALKNRTIEALLEESLTPETLDFSTYVTSLGEQACLQYMTTRVLPVTGQEVDWQHVLCWIARDQALGLRQYFEWRIDDGSGLRRKAKDPPALVRMTLGVLTDAEVAAERKIWKHAAELSKARDALGIEEQRSANTRNIVETQLRKWAGVSSSLRMIADDLFAGSVEQEIQRKTRQIEAQNEADRTAIDNLDSEIVVAVAELQALERIVQLTKARWDEAVALRNNDETALREIRERRDNLLTLSGTCQFGGVTYGDCRHVQEQRTSVRFTTSRDVGVLSRAVDERQEREAEEKSRYEREAAALDSLRTAQDGRYARKAVFTKAIDGRSRQLGRSEAIRETLTQWQENQETPETEALRSARTTVQDLEQKTEAAKREKMLAQHQTSEREQQISNAFASLAQVFGANGRYVTLDERRPFQMLGADGDAYTVLEILLGDLVCAAEGSESRGSHPGLLILDCPREREMSPHLYERFVTLVDEVCQKTPGLQVIITTTTPPPEPLRVPPARVLMLSHASEKHLLLKRRIENLLSRTAPFSPGTSEEESV